ASKLYGRTIAEALGDRPVLVLAHLPRQGTAKHLLEVDPQTRLVAGDRLVLCGEPRTLVPLLAESEGADAPHLMWASRLRRWGRIAQRTLAELDRAVVLCTLVFVTVVVTSTLVLHFGNEKLTLIDALLRTLSIMSVGGNLHEEDYPTAGTKLFVSVLRVTGVALMGLFTAIVTNYLLRAR